MPRFLVVAATLPEVRPLLDHYSIPANDDTGILTRELDPFHISVLVTGVGMVNTAYWLGKFSEKEYDHVINIGVCGAFDRTLELGEIVNISKDTLSEMGAEDDAEFIPYKALNLGGSNTYAAKPEAFLSQLKGVKQVNGITVNKVHGNGESIAWTEKTFEPAVESMEGAAFLRGCETFSSFIQLRAVSNYVERRDKSKWQLKQAIENVNRMVIKLIDAVNAAL